MRDILVGVEIHSYHDLGLAARLDGDGVGIDVALLRRQVGGCYQQRP